MSDLPKLIRWKRCEDAADVAREAAKRILAASRSAIARRGRFKIVLAGGHTPEQAYRLLVDADTDWSRWHIYFGDERCLPGDHPERNSTMALSAWLEHVDVLKKNVHPIQAERGAEAAAQAYRAEIKDARPFDMVLLGMGEDGHTASLFPGLTYNERELVHAVHEAPKPPSDRVSLSRASLSNARDVLVLVTGSNKNEAVQRWRSGESLPVNSVYGLTGVDILIDSAAAGSAC